MYSIMTGQIDLSQTCAPVVIPENELAVYPVPVRIEEGEEKLLVRAAKVARERGMDEAEEFFLREFDTICDDSSLFVDEWDMSVTEGAHDSVLHLAGLVYSGNILEVEDMIESGIVKDFNHYYLVARYYECQGCIPALQRAMHTLQCIKETALDQDDPQFNKYLFRRALCDEWYFGGNGVITLKELFLAASDSWVLLDNLRRIILARGCAQPQSQYILISAFLNPDCRENQFKQLCSLTKLADMSQWQAFLDYVADL